LLSGTLPMNQDADNDNTPGNNPKLARFR